MYTDLYNALAAVLTYPGEDYFRRVAHCLALAQAVVIPSEGEPRRQDAQLSRDLQGEPESRDLHGAGLLARCAASLRSLSTTQQQELFTQTFDLNPVCSLELGWHLFGENYDRGLLLVKMRQQLRLHGLEESTELPDHLTCALRLLARMDRESAATFTEAIVLPALEKMLAALRGKENPYENVLEAVRQVLHAAFPEIPVAAAAAESPLRVLA